MPYSKQTVRVEIPRSSGHNLSHRNSGTMKVGRLQPLLVEEVIPGTRCHLEVPEVVQLPPLASDTYMNLKLKHEAFFVPMRLLSKSFEDWFVDQYTEVSVAATEPSQSTEVKPCLPFVNFRSGIISTEEMTRYFGPDTLADYMGIMYNREISRVPAIMFNIAPFVAYHLLWQEYYRNTQVQRKAFVPQVVLPGSGDYTKEAKCIPYTYFFKNARMEGTPSNNEFVGTPSSSAYLLNDGVNIFSFRQRNFGFDYFTGARPNAQAGQPATLQLAVADGQASFTIAQLRAANSLQQFRERNNIGSLRFIDQLYARYGVKPSDGVAQRPIFIGSSTYDVMTRGVDQTSSGVSDNSNNPFSGVASQYGRGVAMGNGTLIDDFTVTEPGYIMVLQSLVPEVTYSTGMAPMFVRYIKDGSIVEMANPLLQNMGDEPISTDMLSGFPTGMSQEIFGYQDRYGTFMFHRNEAHGQFRDGESLDAFVLQRSFMDSGLTLSSDFLEIPTSYLDQVLAVTDEVSGVSAWYDAKLIWKITNPLAEFSLPSLQDPAYEHGESINLVRNGQVF